MTTELEKQFFDTFEIEPKYKDYRTKNGKEYECKNPNNRNIRLCYPKITDRHYLELICVLNKYFADTYQCCSMFASQTIKEIRNDILKQTLEIIEQHRQLEDEDLENLDDIRRCRKFKNQVQELFKGE